MSREAMQQALEALELAQIDVHWELNSPTRKVLRKAEKCLRAALAEQSEPKRGPSWCDIHQHYKPCEHNTAEQAQRVADAARVIEWATSTPRKAAVNAFTEGAERQAAYWIEWAEARVVNRRLTTEQAQPLSGLDVERLLEDVVGSLPVARKLIRAVEAEVLKRVGVQR